ncbi:HAD hydrolase-like protein [Plantibacter flavus]|uniref:HAD family hydrolase n=1 Tax=Plantibacter flavus TaxID=150123 RepID=UPI003F1372FD
MTNTDRTRQHDTGAAEVDGLDVADLELDLDTDLDDLDEAFDDHEDDLLLELVVLDLAGTTVADDGVVEDAFRSAAGTIGIDTEDALGAAIELVRDTMGQSKLDVFLMLTGGDEARAQAGNAAFEAAYERLITEGRVEAIAGAEETVRLLLELDIRVVFTTGFAPATRDALLDSLGWSDLADDALSPADAGRGRPFPDLPLTALIRTGASAVDTMVVVGDTASDMLSGVSAGAGLVVGVLTGAHDEETLLAAGADEIIASIAELPALLGLD